MNKLLNWIIKYLFKIPLIGEINDRFLYSPPSLIDKSFGETTRFPSVLEIYIDKNASKPIDIGKLTHEILFKDYPTMVFNVCFSCSRPHFWTNKSNYANPRSHWFNVFFGFYEINAPQSKWNRPFGFISGDSAELNKADLIKLAKADWNYFSNYMYGVPQEVCKQNSSISGNETIRVLNPSKTINEHSYIEAEVENIQVVSGYESVQGGLVNNHPLFSPLWRKVFGTFPPEHNYPKSFIPTKMKMRFYIRYDSDYDSDLDETSYNTYIYGGSINMDFPDSEYNERFLNAQLTGIRNSINKQAFRKNKETKVKAIWKNNTNEG